MEVGAAFSIGSMECQVIADGVNAYAPEDVFSTVPPDKLRELVGSELDENGLLLVPYNALLVRTSHQVVLIDTGAGESAGELGAPAGHLQESLQRAGIRPSDVDLVIISHAHPDHIGGLTTSRGERQALVFGSARHVIARQEWEFWTSAEVLAGLPEFVAGAARHHLPVLENSGRLELVDGEVDVLTGVRLVPAPGHTPGHMVVELTSGGEKGMFGADVVLHELNFERPELLSAFDGDPAMALQTRKQILGRAAHEKGVFVGFHLKKIGRVEQTQHAYRLRSLNS